MTKDLTLYTIYKIPSSETNHIENGINRVLRYRCYVLDEDFTPLRSYLIYETRHRGKIRLVCECTSGMNEHCRHRDMLSMFIKQRKVNSRAMFCYDLKCWMKQEKLDEQNEKSE